MEQKKATKITSLLISVVVFCLVFANNEWMSVGIYKDCGLGNRLLYPFFHAGFLHAILNAWCLLSVVFIYNISMVRLFTAYLLSISIPSFLLMDVPTVGLSGVVFVLFGSISFEVGRKLYYQVWMIAYLLLGFLFPNTNGLIHLYCYAMGCVVALLNKPFKIR